MGTLYDRQAVDRRLLATNSELHVLVISLPFTIRLHRTLTLPPAAGGRLIQLTIARLQIPGCIIK